MSGNFLEPRGYKEILAELTLVDTNEYIKIEGFYSSREGGSVIAI